jgi:enoyl-CoA hydratase/carnithine racemase
VGAAPRGVGQHGGVGGGPGPSSGGVDLHEAGVRQDAVDVDRVVERANLVASKGPVAVAMSKRAIYRGYDLPLESALELEKQIFAGLFGTEDQKEGMRAFVEKRKPQFKGA